MKRLSRPRQQGLPILRIISALMLISSMGLFIFELLTFSSNTSSLPVGITVAGIDIGNQSESEAALQLEGIFSSPITLYYFDSPINLTPDEIGFQLNTAVMLAQARASGDVSGGFWVRFLNHLVGQNAIQSSDIPLVSSFQENALRERLAQIAEVYDRPVGTVAFDLNSLTISSGETGYRLDIDQAIQVIDNALRSPTNRAVDLPVIGGEVAQTSLSVLSDMIIGYLNARGFIYDGQTSIASVYILDLTTGEEINILSDVAFSAASTNKVGIMIDLFRQINREMNQDEAFLLANSLLCSNNSSSNRIMEVFLGNGNIFAGIASVTNTVQAIGAKDSFLIAPFYEGVASQQLGYIEAPDTNPNPNFDTQPDTFNQTTAEDMGILFGMIYDCATYGSGLMTVYPNGEFTQNECRQMLEIMSANDLNRLLQAGLPVGTRISHKNGWIPGRLAGAAGATTGDAGIVFSPNGRHYVISVYLWEETDGTGFERWDIIEEISRAAWNYFNPENALPARRSDLPDTAQECLRVDSQGVVLSYNYLPPYGSVDLNNINGWRNGTTTTPQPLPGQESSDGN